MMNSEELEQQLASYAGFLDEVSRDRLPDLTSNPTEIEGDVIMVDLLTRTEDEAAQDESGGFDRRGTWLMAIAAACALIATFAFLVPSGEEGGLQTTDTPDSTGVPEPSDVSVPAEPDSVDSAVVETAPPSVWNQLVEAMALESNELLSEIYAEDAAVRIDGLDFEGGQGFNFATDTGVSEQLDIRYNNCSESVVDGVETAVCNWKMDFSFLEGTVSPQEGEATLTAEGGVITSLELVSTNFDQIVSELSLYRAWVDLGPESADELFTSFGTLRIGEQLADRHAAAAADFLEATDIASDPANVGNLLMATLRSGDPGTVERVFGNLSTWREPLFSVTGLQLAHSFVGGDPAIGRDLANFDLANCSESNELVRCELLLTYPFIQGFGETPGSAEITVRNGQISVVRIAFDEPAFSELHTKMVDYQKWLDDMEPGISGLLFMTPELIQLTAESIALHDQYGPQWSAQLSD